ncbi:LPS export ABC transporter periplasmic protein LptC [Herminiimonas fonticola]|uniref:Lipopolysaccharide export system protein LptC n=1 Tax=Herminiimonas fonticola TaxID=303380 RepID=A0A4R6GGP2_9BURK|nr:LPS export ABC transporter periplasmic protein LptC [Herminiimonas fonticola]RBA24863.1 Lipopolysaccharide-assembly, LptC-related [Herminiimonas fonticola]TDN93977.1 lipopolysaccharide export system protein LptC [Herminiimonas fonticola]
MKAIRPATGVRLIVLIVISAALALGSFWLVEVMQKKTEESMPDRVRTEPDFYVEKFNFVRMAKTGEARYNLTGTGMKHYPQDDSYQIQNPVMHSYSAERPPMVSRSLRATISNNSSEIHMYDNVHIDRPASATSQHFQLKTSYLLVLPDDDVMKTPKPVELILGKSTLNGSGMFANNATGEFRLSSNVKGQYQPPVVTN